MTKHAGFGDTARVDMSRLPSETKLEAEGVVFSFRHGTSGDRLVLSRPLPGFSGERSTEGEIACPLTPENAFALRERFPWLRPCRIRDGATSFGFGDRLGMATPGHVRALRNSGVFPVLAQQSVRENARTGRSFDGVLADAIFGAFRQGYRSGFGADADHLKTPRNAVNAARLGYTFFTCDPGDVVHPTEAMAHDEVRSRFAELPDGEGIRRRYQDRSHSIGGSVLRFTDEALLRASVKYTEAIDRAAEMYRALVEAIGRDFDYEVSVDETETPTTPLEHLFITLELHRRGVEFTSLAPRFVGAMEKGVDWRGDVLQFERDLCQHAAIAREMGGYRLSLHSGSDKFTLYPLLARATGGLCHVKTAGTSYLVALDVVARRRPNLFREIAAQSIASFVDDRATYHISADPSRIPPLETVPDRGLPELVAAHDSRQVLHVAYGSILSSPLGERLRSVLREQEEEHLAALAGHLGRHIAALEVRKGV